MKTGIIYKVQRGKYMVSTKFLKKLKDEYNIVFNDEKLLEEAFTHSSYSNEHPNDGIRDYEKLEFLGDAVLELAVSDYLYRHYPKLNEGELTDEKLDQYIQMSKIIEFFKYILHCLLSFFSSAIGSTPDDFTLKEFVTAVFRKNQRVLPSARTAGSTRRRNSLFWPCLWGQSSGAGTS